MADIPNYGALANQQYDANADAARLNTWAGRPDQTNAMGTITWNQSPDGRWTNSNSLSGAAQGVFNTGMWGQQNLAGQVGNGVDMGSLPAWGNTDLTRGAVGMPDSGFGATQSVIDAWNGLQNPGLQKQEDAARARAAAMGLTMGSTAWGDQERALGNTRLDAGNKAIIEGTKEYQNVFNRGLASRQQTVDENLKQANLANTIRNSASGERTAAYNANVAGLGQLGNTVKGLDPNEWATKPGAVAPILPRNIYGAAADTYAAQVGQQNQATAASNSNNAMYGQLGAAALGNSGFWNAAGSALGGAWNWLTTDNNGNGSVWY